MKKIILLTSTTLMLSTSVFAAGNIRAFVGKYSVGSCHISGTTAYAGLDKNKKGEVSGVLVRFFGDDPVAFSIGLGTQREKPSWSGSPIKYSEETSVLEGQKLVSTTVNVYKNGQREVASRKSLEKTATGLIIRETEGAEAPKSCVLTRI